MDLIADILLVAGALSVAFYCFILSRRLSRFTNLEQGVGGAVAVLSAQVDDLTRTLERARKASEESGTELRDLTARAETVARRLELHVASLHDLPDAEERPAPSASHDAGPAPEVAPEPQPQAREAAAPVPSFFASKRAALQEAT